MPTPRIFVGTLHVDEAEFDACKAALAAQVDVRVTHHVISGLPELEAHNSLWSTWNGVKTEFDLFVKIDADTVLMHEDALICVWRLFEHDCDVTGPQIPILDYYTDRLIVGLNCFTPTVIFTPAQSRLHCDRVDTNHKKVLRDEQVTDLTPIAWHGQEPALEQAFHFGLHRGRKKQWGLLSKVAVAWLEKGGAGRLWALAGAHAASRWWPHRTDYKSTAFRRRFDRAQRDEELEAKVKRFSARLVAHAKQTWL